MMLTNALPVEVPVTIDNEPVLLRWSPKITGGVIAAATDPGISLDMTARAILVMASLDSRTAAASESLRDDDVARVTELLMLRWILHGAESVGAAASDSP